MHFIIFIMSFYIIIPSIQPIYSSDALYEYKIQQYDSTLYYGARINFSPDNSNIAITISSTNISTNYKQTLYMYKIDGTLLCTYDFKISKKTDNPIINQDVFGYSYDFGPISLQYQIDDQAQDIVKNVNIWSVGCKKEYKWQFNAQAYQYGSSFILSQSIGLVKFNLKAYISFFTTQNTISQYELYSKKFVKNYTINQQSLRKMPQNTSKGANYTQFIFQRYSNLIYSPNYQYLYSNVYNQNTKQSLTIIFECTTGNIINLNLTDQYFKLTPLRSINNQSFLGVKFNDSNFYTQSISQEDKVLTKVVDLTIEQKNSLRKRTMVCTNQNFVVLTYWTINNTKQVLQVYQTKQGKTNNLIQRIQFEKEQNLQYGCYDDKLAIIDKGLKLRIYKFQDYQEKQNQWPYLWFIVGGSGFLVLLVVSIACFIKLRKRKNINIQPKHKKAQKGINKKLLINQSDYSQENNIKNGQHLQSHYEYQQKQKSIFPGIKKQSIRSDTYVARKQLNAPQTDTYIARKDINGGKTDTYIAKKQVNNKPKTDTYIARKQINRQQQKDHNDGRTIVRSTDTYIAKVRNNNFQQGSFNKGNQRRNQSQRRIQPQRRNREKRQQNYYQYQKQHYGGNGLNVIQEQNQQFTPITKGYRKYQYQNQTKGDKYNENHNNFYQDRNNRISFKEDRRQRVKDNNNWIIKQEDEGTDDNWQKRQPNMYRHDRETPGNQIETKKPKINRNIDLMSNQDLNNKNYNQTSKNNVIKQKVNKKDKSDYEKSTQNYQTDRNNIL